MNLAAVKDQLRQIEEVTFELPNGEKVPAHFHVTEVGMVRKDFIDCGGTVRQEKVANFQLWESGLADDHRLAPEKLIKIIELSEEKLGLENLEVEVEFQTDLTMGKFGLAKHTDGFKLTAKQTDCLAKDLCGTPMSKVNAKLADLPLVKAVTGGCTPGGGCC